MKQDKHAISGLSALQARALLSASQMQAVDARAVDQGLVSYALMLNAGKAVAQSVVNVAQGTGGKVLIFAGPGNNGGDGVIAAIALLAQDYDVELIRVGPAPAEHTDASRAWQTWSAPYTELALEMKELCASVKTRIAQANVIVDALFGAGLSRPLQGSLAQLVEQINQAEAAVVSVDVPSGLDGNTHTAEGACIQADVTVSFFLAKAAHYLYPGRGLCGIFDLQQIGLGKPQLDEAELVCFLNGLPVFEKHLPVLSAEMHKFDRGHVLVRSGPSHATGAARLSASSALRCGAGLVTLASNKEAMPINAAQLTAVMLRECDSHEHWHALLSDKRFTTVLIGPGNGVDEQTRRCALLALSANRHCILDASALSCWQETAQLNGLITALSACAQTAVLTPHAGEFQRLFAGLDLYQLPSKLHQACAAAELSGSVIIYKGADTVIASPDGRSCINANAPPWLATAGAGDVLAGVIAALITQGMPAFEAACAAVWLHGEAAQNIGYPLSAEQLLTQVPIELGRISPVNRAG